MLVKLFEDLTLWEGGGGGLKKILSAIKVARTISGQKVNISRDTKQFRLMVATFVDFHIP